MAEQIVGDDAARAERKHEGIEVVKGGEISGKKVRPSISRAVRAPRLAAIERKRERKTDERTGKPDEQREEKAVTQRAQIVRALDGGKERP